MTTICLYANDQLLSVALKQKIASGSQNSVVLHVDFDAKWDGYAKSAVFFTSDNETVYEMILTNGECTVPHEVLAESCVLYIGVRGVNSTNNAVKTSTLVKYKIAEGAPSGDGTTVVPTPDVYQQILTAYGKLNSDIAVERARITNIANLDDGSTSGDAELMDIRVGFDGTTYANAGEAVRTQARHLSEDVDRIHEHMVDSSSSYTFEGKELVLSGLNLTTGAIMATTAYAMEKDKRPIKLLSDNIEVNVAEGYRIRGCVYDEHMNFIEPFSWVTQTEKPVALQNRAKCFINFYIGKSDGTNIDISAIPSNVVEVRCTFTKVEDVVEDITEVKSGTNNIFDPSNIQYGGNFDFTDGVTFSATGTGWVTPNFIPVGSDVSNLYFITTITDTVRLMLVYSYSDDEFLGYNSARFTADGRLVISVFSGATKIRLYSNATLDGHDLCVSTTDIDEYEEYVPKHFVKESALPKKSLERGFDGKVIVNFGDSIFGLRRPPDDISTELARLTGATVHNCGFGGCRMSKHNMDNFDAFSMYRLADAVASGEWSYQDEGIADTTNSENVPSYFAEGLAILKGLDFSKVDIVTIAYGTNDFTASVNLDNANNAYDTSTFAGALRHSVEALLTAYPHLKIFVCSQTYRFQMDGDGIFTEDSDTETNSNQVKLTDFVAKTEALAKEYHLPYINNYDIGMNKYNRSQYFAATDGTHPITTGCKLIATHMAKKLF